MKPLFERPEPGALSMRSRGVLTASCFIGLAILIGARIECSRPTGSSSPSAPEVPLSAGDRRTASTPDTERGEAGELAREGARTSLPSSLRPLRGRVLERDGGPVADARVQWLALQKEDTEPTPAWPSASWGDVSRQAVGIRTGNDGSFEFARPPAGGMPFGSVLVVQHSEHTFGGLDLPEDPATWPPEFVIRLDPTAPLEILVLTADGRPQPGALVHHAGVPRTPASENPSPLARHERFLSQEAQTDESGTARLAPFRGEQAFWAEFGELVSVPWQGPRPNRVVLRLVESFTVGGTIALRDWKDWDAEYEGERRIRIAGEEGNLWRPLGCLRDVGSGPWGPVRVPLSGATRFAVRLEGVPIVPIEERFDPPRPGTYRRIDFTAGRESEVNLMVLDEAENPITNASAIAWWEAFEAPTTAQRVEGSSRPDGRLYLGGLPSGNIRYQVWAPGFSSEEGLLDTGYSALVTLTRAGRIQGRCLHEGQPVSDFQVVFWDRGQRRSQTFFGREDGRFTLEGLRPGDWSLQATSPRYPLGRPETVRVNETGEVSVELELPTAMRGTGRVVAQDTGEPIALASVQPYSTGGVDRFFPWGPPVSTAQDGSFELDAFVTGLNWITVTADGYARTDVKKTARNDEPFDWGDVRLARPRALEIQLIGLEEPNAISPLDLLASTLEDSPTPLPTRKIGADGILRYEDVSPGNVRLFLKDPEEGWSRLDLDLEEGRDWHFDFKVAGDRRLHVTALEEDGKPVSNETAVLLSAQEDNGVFVLRLRYASAEGTADFEGIRAEEVEIAVVGPDGGVRATKNVAFRADARLEATVQIGGSTLRLRVVDRQGNPIAGVSVHVRSRDGNQLLGLARTDSDGWASLLGVPQQLVLLDLTHGIAGFRQGIVVDASLNDQVFELDASGRIGLRLLDGEPLLGVSVRIETERGVALSSTRVTDQNGTASFDAAGEGTYRLACSRSDCWPVEVTISLADGERIERTLAMRRLADLELTLRRADGIPIGGTDVSLRSLEFGVDVAEWLGAGRVTSASGLRTDGLGVLSVEGLPRGSYEWSVGGEATASGTFELLPAQRNRVEARLPAR